MPGPVKNHHCVCGESFATFINLTVHRRMCDSWQEHVRGIREDVHNAERYHQLHRVNPDPTPTDQPNGRPACPYCERDFGNWPLMFAHLDVCGERATREVVNAPKALKALDTTAEAAAKLLAFEAWCAENGRP